MLSDSNVTSLAVIGCGCSAATQQVAKFTHYWKAPLVSCTRSLQTKICISISSGRSCALYTQFILLLLHTCMQISYASSSSVLNDKSVYPSFFRTAPSDDLLAPALAILVNYYGWRQVAILTETSPQFLEVCISKYFFSSC